MEVPYVPTTAFAGIVTDMVGFQLAEFTPETPVAVCTAAGGYRAVQVGHTVPRYGDVQRAPATSVVTGVPARIARQRPTPPARPTITGRIGSLTRMTLPGARTAPKGVLRSPSKHTSSGRDGPSTTTIASPSVTSPYPE